MRADIDRVCILAQCINTAQRLYHITSTHREPPCRIDTMCDSICLTSSLRLPQQRPPLTRSPSLRLLHKPHKPPQPHRPRERHRPLQHPADPPILHLHQRVKRHSHPRIQKHYDRTRGATTPVSRRGRTGQRGLTTPSVAQVPMPVPTTPPSLIPCCPPGRRSRRVAAPRARSGSGRCLAPPAKSVLSLRPQRCTSPPQRQSVSTLRRRRSRTCGDRTARCALPG
ncbi:uncharacterized protein CC84DRAFT_37133 [Paraphaeosphaeria sporulosa]|uniref:Uncharacterized protein n=1 Tax=Paraphaeosphaeria sporulosa TaxID=1460663 RepID=A0A177CX63_9PLEO|nr:uncharacterized protein CC84DRAFT_37133 [Paraphaeosphaeria sporulosa]OAG11450.1 hypothetical protein CC84DRAFT_37133 [Paraphaeosphaeria sporulosa]